MYFMIGKVLGLKELNSVALLNHKWILLIWLHFTKITVDAKIY